MTRIEKIVWLLKDMEQTGFTDKQFSDACKDQPNDEQFQTMMQFVNREYDNANEILAEIEKYGQPYELDNENKKYRLLLQITAYEDTTRLISSEEPNNDLIQGLLEIYEELNTIDGIEATIECDKHLNIIFKINANFHKEYNTMSEIA